MHSRCYGSSVSFSLPGSQNELSHLINEILGKGNPTNLAKPYTLPCFAIGIIEFAGYPHWLSIVSRGGCTIPNNFLILPRARVGLTSKFFGLARAAPRRLCRIMPIWTLSKRCACLSCNSMTWLRKLTSKCFIGLFQSRLGHGCKDPRRPRLWRTIRRARRRPR